MHTQTQALKLTHAYAHTHHFMHIQGAHDSTESSENIVFLFDILLSPIIIEKCEIIERKKAMENAHICIVCTLEFVRC